MTSLVKLEWLKLKGNRFFWIAMGLFILLMALLLVYFGDINVFGQKSTAQEGEAQNMLEKSFGQAGLYKLPHLWHNLGYLAGFFKFIPAFVLIFFVANEFQYRTLRQNIIDGLNEWQFFLSKLAGLLILLFISIGAIGFTIFILGLLNNNLNDISIWSGATYLLALLLEYLLYMSFSLMIVLLVKRSAISIILVLVYYLLIEQIGIAIIKGQDLTLWQYLPMAPGRELILQPFTRLLELDMFTGQISPVEVSKKFMGLSFLYSLIYLSASWLILKKRDL
jgi:ABC-type transport system involved in multi-copper enzyme maturation permease subunit